MPLAQNRKRARSDDEKEARRRAILAAAREMAIESGFDDMTMSGLAKRAGLSKGTLYLYVRTKEELFLALYVDALETLVSRIENEATADNLVDLMGSLPQQVPLFLPLLARLAAVIEANVSDDALFEAKRTMWAQGGRVAAVISRIAGVPIEKAGQVAAVLMMALQGAAQYEIGAGRSPATVPDDLKPILIRQDFATQFTPAARLILSTVLPSTNTPGVETPPKHQ